MPDLYTPALEAELHRAGIRVWRIETGKHHKLKFTHQGREMMIVYSQSPSDRRSAKNTVADLRRMLGLKAPARGKSARPPKRRTPPPDRALELSGVVGHDPWAELAGLLTHPPE